MAFQNKEKNGGPKLPPAPESMTGSESPVVSPGITALERKELFAIYEKAEAAVIAATQALDEAFDARSNAVRRISEKSGNGPYLYKGVKTSVMARQNKTTGKVTWFFRQPGEEQKLVEI